MNDCDLLFHILSACIGKELGIPGCVMLSIGLLHHLGAQAHGARPIVPDGLDATRVHCLEANDHRTVDDTTSDQRASELEAC